MSCVGMDLQDILLKKQVADPLQEPVHCTPHLSYINRVLVAEADPEKKTVPLDCWRQVNQLKLSQSELDMSKLDCIKLKH